MPLSATISRSFGAGAQALASLKRNLEIAQIAVVDADQRRFERQGAVEFGFVMRLDQHVHMQVMRRDIEGARLLIVDAGHDDENAVGAGGARFKDLIGVEHEILAQDRQMGGGARRREVVEPPWKDGPSVSTDRQVAPPAS